MAIRSWLDRFGSDVVTVDLPVKPDLEAARHFLSSHLRNREALEPFDIPILLELP